MVFSVYKYKSFHNENKEKWPIQPPTQEAWNEMSRLDYEYCQTKARATNRTDVPSYHPYWRKQVRIKIKEQIKFHKSNLRKIKKYPSIAKFIYSATANEYTVNQIISRLKKSIE